MAVYYRYRSGMDTFSLPLATPSISVRDLKRLILSTGRHGPCKEGIAVSDAHTGHQYTWSAESVPRDSTVLVHLLPNLADDDTIVAGSKEDSSEEAKAISAAVELEWEEMTRCITTAEKQTTIGGSTTEAPAPAEEDLVGHPYWPRHDLPAFFDEMHWKWGPTVKPWLYWIDRSGRIHDYFSDI